MENLETPIPIKEHKKSTSLARQTPVDPTHDLWKEKLVDVGAMGISSDSYYAATDGMNAPYGRPINGSIPRVLCRQSVAEKLGRINLAIKPKGLGLHVWDGYRSLACQTGLWEFFLAEVKRKHPGLSEDEQIQLNENYCSNPTKYNLADSTTWPTHLTGGAVDLTLKRLSTGELLHMGGIFDDASEVSNTDYFEKMLQERPASMTDSDKEALKNRRILYNAMLSEGFSNFDFEWWHYDWGNQFWIANANVMNAKNMPAQAHYGPATLP